ncbi:MAG: cellulose biosynthesis protein BcsF [Campylobacter sp.]
MTTLDIAQIVFICIVIILGLGLLVKVSIFDERKKSK